MNAFQRCIDLGGGDECVFVSENWSYVYACVSVCILGQYNSMSVLWGEAWTIYFPGTGQEGDFVFAEIIL